eukprot:Lankesteria_metandrocarpae@DN1135_c0_g1_i1.p1
MDVVTLSAPRGKGTFVVICDTSDLALGAALLQMQDVDLVLLEFASKKLNNAEKLWATREKEAFPIRWSVEQFSCYLKGMKFMVLTDHASLQWMDNSSSGKVRRWSLY